MHRGLRIIYSDWLNFCTDNDISLDIGDFICSLKGRPDQPFIRSWGNYHIEMFTTINNSSHNVVILFKQHWAVLYFSLTLKPNNHTSHAKCLINRLNWTMAVNTSSRISIAQNIQRYAKFPVSFYSILYSMLYIYFNRTIIYRLAFCVYWREEPACTQC